MFNFTLIMVQHQQKFRLPHDVVSPQRGTAMEPIIVKSLLLNLTLELGAILPVLKDGSKKNSAQPPM